MPGVREALEEQRERRAYARYVKFKALIATPSTWAAPIAMPAAAKLFVKLGALVAVNTVAFTVNGRSYYVKAGTAANVVNPVAYIENKETLTAVYNASTMQLFIQHPNGKLKLIASKP